MDPVWYTVDNNFQTNYLANGATGLSVPNTFTDLMGWSRLLYDNDYIYGLFYTQDDTINDISTNSWERDCWEVYFDADNSKTPAAFDRVDDIQLRFQHATTSPADIETGFGTAGAWLSGDFWAVSTWDRAGVEIAVLDDTLNTGWYTEWKIPLESLKLDNTPGTVFGFELQQGDNDANAAVARESISKWWWAGATDPSWNDASAFGTAYFSAKEVDGALPLYSTTTVPVIDGKEDAIWNANASWFSQNHYNNNGSTGINMPYSYADISGGGALMYDDINVYGFFTAWDDTINDISTNSWERDCWEVYFDADNSKTPAAFDRVDDVQLRFQHATTASTDIETGFGTAGAWLSGDFWAVSTWNRNGVLIAVFDTTKVFDTGDEPNVWNVEWQIPLESLKLDNTVGTQFGFETQQGDNDANAATARESISKWWWGMGNDPSWNDASAFGTAVFAGANPDVGVRDRSISSAKNFQLAQNYPNPFNPTTTIAYTLNSVGKVRLSVYDLMGKEVAILVDGIQPAGQQKAQFNASKLSSGIYFYKLQTAGQVLTRKMTLVK
jgi:hypothetical protein